MAYLRSIGADDRNIAIAVFAKAHVVFYFTYDIVQLVVYVGCEKNAESVCDIFILILLRVLVRVKIRVIVVSNCSSFKWPISNMHYNTNDFGEFFTLIHYRDILIKTLRGLTVRKEKCNSAI